MNQQPATTEPSRLMNQERETRGYQHGSGNFDHRCGGGIPARSVVGGDSPSPPRHGTRLGKPNPLPAAGLMTPSITTDGPGSALVPVTDPPRVAGSAQVLDTVVVDGELVVPIKPTPYRDVTGRRVDPGPDTGSDPGIGITPQHLLARLGLHYVGPLTPEQAARFGAQEARWEARSWWRRWGSDFADWCWRRWR
jgi:hypothetical protein